MASMASSNTHFFIQNISRSNCKSSATPKINLSVVSQMNNQEESPNQTTHQKSLRKIILRGNEVAVLGDLLPFSKCGTKPDYLGVQKNPPGLALCPATKICVSTSENTVISHTMRLLGPAIFTPRDKGILFL